MTNVLRHKRTGLIIAALAVVIVIAALIATGALGTSRAATTRAARRSTGPVSPAGIKPAAPSSRAATPTPDVTGSPDADAPEPATSAAPGTRPVRVQIPSIRVDSTLESLGIEADGTLASPSAWQRAGWYAGGVHPGDTGPAVIAGHVDSTQGPAVFFRLRDLKPGAKVVVTDADRAKLTFVVDGTQQFPKKTFPTSAVYGPSALPLLRLITCTGQFDQADRSYLDNLVVTTHLVNP